MCVVNVAKDFVSAGLARGDEPIDDTDLIEIGVRVKHMTVIERAEGWYLCFSAYHTRFLLILNLKQNKRLFFQRQSVVECSK